MKQLMKKREVTMAMVLILLVIVISLISPNFLKINNLTNILMNNIILAIMAMGMTLVIITSGIDVSVGSQLGVCAIVVGLVATSDIASLPMIILAGLACGVLLGCINALFITVAEIPPIVVTLGMLSVYRGGILLYTKGKWVTELPLWYRNLYQAKFIGIPLPILLLIALFIATLVLIKYARIGRSIYAYGGNKTAASRVGINSSKVTFFVYGFMGLMVGVASILYGSQLGIIDPNAGTNFEMLVIASVIIGGTNILGGSGSLSGTLIGVLILGVLQNGMVLMHIETYWQDVVMGLLIISAVSIDILKKRHAEEKKNRIQKVDSNNVGGAGYEANA